MGVRQDGGLGTHGVGDQTGNGGSDKEGVPVRGGVPHKGWGFSHGLGFQMRWNTRQEMGHQM